MGLYACLYLFADPVLPQSQRARSQARRAGELGAGGHPAAITRLTLILLQTALDYVLSHPTLEKSKIFLYGQSIGGAVAVFLASQNASRVRRAGFRAVLRYSTDLTFSHRPMASSLRTPSCRW